MIINDRDLILCKLRVFIFLSFDLPENLVASDLKPHEIN